MSEGDGDPFDILGLEPGCSTEDVKSAFRKAVSSCHPDTESGRTDPRAAERFRACVDAKDTLMDPARRAAAERSRRPAAASGFSAAFDTFFDNIDRNGRGAAANGGGPRPRRGHDVEKEVSLSLEQAYRGGAFVLGGTPGPCAPCGATGKVTVAEPVGCPDCGATGSLRRTHGLMTVRVECPACAGKGRTRQAHCPSCGGQGRTAGAGTPYEVPPGARDGMMNVLRGYGAPGFAGGPRGDLRLVYRIRPHRHFAREGSDLVARLRVPVWDAALGCSRSLPGIDGHPIEVEVPAGTEGGSVIRVPNRGMPAFPGRGEIRFEVRIAVPAADTPEMRDAYARLRAASAAAAAAADAGEGIAAT